MTKQSVLPENFNADFLNYVSANTEIQLQGSEDQAAQTVKDSKVFQRPSVISEANNISEDADGSGIENEG